MKTVILTTEQVNRILEEENNINIDINATANTTSAFSNAFTQNKQKISNASKMGDPVVHISNANASNGSNDNMPTQHVEVEAGQSPEEAIRQQLNQTATSQGSDVVVSGPGVNECCELTKADVEKIRKNTIRNRKQMK